jgi:inorganic pyrophosphatase
LLRPRRRRAIRAQVGVGRDADAHLSSLRLFVSIRVHLWLLQNQPLVPFVAFCSNAVGRDREIAVRTLAGEAVSRGMNFVKVSPLMEKNLVRIIVETPKGSRNKLSYDPELKLFALKKTLPEGMVFPFDFGFIPRTKGEDGDPLDALVMMPESLPPGTAVACRIIGLIEARQSEAKRDKGIRNDRYLAVSDAAGEFQNLNEPDDLPDGMLEELEKFFVNYNELEGRRFKLLGVKGPKAALKAIRRAVKRGAAD